MRVNSIEDLSWDSLKIAERLGISADEIASRFYQMAEEIRTGRIVVARDGTVSVSSEHLQELLKCIGSATIVFTELGKGKRKLELPMPSCAPDASPSGLVGFDVASRLSGAVHRIAPKERYSSLAAAYSSLIDYF